MTKKQELALPELLQNFIMSSRMEGLTVSDGIQAMCLSVVSGERTLEECLHQLNAKYSRS